MKEEKVIMETHNTKERYGLVAQVLHWGIFAIFIALYVVGEMMEDAPKGPQKWALYDLHKSFGISVLFLVFVRIGWTLSNPVPEPAQGMPAYLEKASKITHYALYAIMILMPIGGYIMSVSGGYSVSWFGLFKLPSIMGKNHTLHEITEEGHEIMAGLIIFIVLLHAAAALWHHFYLKDNVLRRMLPMKLK